MRAIVSVVAKDSVGIIAYVSAKLAENNINILDISQTVLHEYFTMIMFVDTEKCPLSFEALRERLAAAGEERGLAIHIQRQDIFDAMYNV